MEKVVEVHELIWFPALTLFLLLTQFSWEQVNVTEWKSRRVKLSCWSQQPPAFQLYADWLGFLLLQMEGHI